MTTEIVVVVKCIVCRTRRDIHPGEVPKDEVPECKEKGCYGIMVAVRAVRRKYD